MKSLLKLVVFTASIALIVVSCGKKADESTAKTDASSNAIVTGDFALESSGVTFTLTGTPTTLAGITFTPASEWTDFGASGMRQASYAFGPLEGETDSATVTVFYFGEGGGGTIQANLDRWVAQMELVEGADPHTFVQKGEIAADGMKVHLIKVDGSYNAGGMMSGASVKKDNYTMVGAVLEAPEGNIFFKLTGPSKTANAMGEAMVGMIEATKKI